MTIHFAPLIRKKQAITYIDDTIMQAQDETKMFEIIDKYHELVRKSKLVKNKVQKFQKFKIFLKPTKPLKNKRKQKSAEDSKILPKTTNWKQTLATTLRIVSHK